MLEAQHSVRRIALFNSLFWKLEHSTWVSLLSQTLVMLAWPSISITSWNGKWYTVGKCARDRGHMADKKSQRLMKARLVLSSFKEKKVKTVKHVSEQASRTVAIIHCVFLSAYQLKNGLFFTTNQGSTVNPFKIVLASFLSL